MCVCVHACLCLYVQMCVRLCVHHSTCTCRCLTNEIPSLAAGLLCLPSMAVPSPLVADGPVCSRTYFSLRKWCASSLTNLDVFVHGAHWPDTEVARQLDLGLWGMWFFFTFQKLKQNPRDKSLRPRPQGLGPSFTPEGHA